MSVRPSGQAEWRQLIPRYWNFFERPENEEVGQIVDIKVDCTFTGGEAVYLDNVLVQAGRRLFAPRNC